MHAHGRSSDEDLEVRISLNEAPISLGPIGQQKSHLDAIVVHSCHGGTQYCRWLAIVLRDLQTRVADTGHLGTYGFAEIRRLTGHLLTLPMTLTTGNTDQYDCQVDYGSLRSHDL
jgi:hypothetical protein